MRLFLHEAIRIVDSSIGNIIGDTVDDVICEDKDGLTITIDKTSVNTEITKLQAEYDAFQYQRDRKAEYYALNQFELISDDDVNGTTTHKDAIAAIKAKYPKP